MKCKFCFAELDEDVTVCPACGKELTEAEEAPVEAAAEETEETLVEETEETEEVSVDELIEETTALLEETDEETAEEVPVKKKSKALKIVLAAVAGVVLVAALVVAVLYGMGVKLSSIGAFFGFTEADVSYKNSYTVSDEKMEKKTDVIVAKVGDQTLTNGQLQVYYWMTARDFATNNYYALDSYGLDVEKPLDEQIYDEKTGQTWQQYFLHNALESWRRYAVFVQRSEDAGFELSQQWQEYIDSYGKEIEAAAVESEYENAEAFIDDLVSKGSSVETYYDYFRIECKALAYLDSIGNELVPTLDELEAYYTANEETFQEAGCGKDDGKLYDVRHIFITVEGETSQLEDGTYGYTEAQWEACREKAQKMLDDFLANSPTEEKFAELAKEHSEDPGSASNGGLYSGLTKNYGFIKEFEDWYVDESRKVGDTGIVKNTGSSKVGYHVMYFSGSKELWKDQAETMVLSEKMARKLREFEEMYPADIDYKKVVLGNADINTSLQ